MATLSITGEKLDIIVRSGSDIAGISFQYLDDDSEPIDLSTYTPSGAIYLNVDGEKVADWVITRPDNFTFVVSLPRDDYANFTTGSECDSLYFHEIWLTDESDIKQPFVYGDFVPVWEDNP